MTLQRKTLLIFSVSFLCLLATLYFASSRILQASIAQSERANAQHTLRASRGLLDQMVEQFNHRFGDWAAWDDAYDFVQNGNRPFIQSNLAGESLQVLRINLVVFLNDKGKPVFATGYDPTKHQKTPVPPRIWELLKNPALTTFKTPRDSHQGLLMVDGRLMILSLHPIVDTEMKGPIRGTLLFGRTIDATEMRRLADWGGVELSIWSLAEGNLPSEFQMARAALLQKPKDGGAFTRPLNEQELGAYGIMRDIEGKPTLLLQAVVPRDAYAHSLENLRYLVGALFVSAIAFGAVTLLSLRRFVLAPLTTLGDDVRRVRDAGDPSARVSVAGERELAMLAGDINNMLAALEQSQSHLHQSIAELEQHSREMMLIAEMGEMLHSCHSREEAGAVLGQSLPRLFAEEAGVLFLMNASQDRVEATLRWGEDEAHGLATQPYFAPDDCWALRRGHVHAVDNPQEQALCAHVAPPPQELPTSYLCLPLMAERQTLGLLHLGARVAAPWPKSKIQLARTVAEHIALALFNIELQATLRYQSTRDPLTGLFNRRHMEESLDREIARAERHGHKVAAILFDADHFKRFNDTFGHEAGDLVLREIAALMHTHSRKMDIACRYGGEEFLLLLPECPMEVAVRRAEELRAAAKALTLRHHGQPLGQTTLSLGVACYPDHAATGECLLRHADTLLYQAKKAGRDRVIF